MQSDGRPNLFEFATSELSQDAFLAWMIAWADEDARSHDVLLGDLGRDFLSALFKKHGKTLPEDPRVQVDVQKDRIDVLAIVDKKFAVLIEDKVGTTEHSGQLERYLEHVAADQSNQQVLPIYVQTEGQPSFEKVEAAGYKVVGRGDLLEVLRRYEQAGGSNTTASDFLEHLQAIDDDFNAYRTTSIDKEWSDRAWQGFFAHLKELFGRGGWGYVPNPRGGFYGFWWGGWGSSDYGKAYLQLESRLEGPRLVFRVECPEKAQRRQARDAWLARVKEAAKDHPDLTVDKPKRFGSGQTMTFAELGGDFRRSGSDGLVDFDKTKEVLDAAQDILERAAEAEA